MSRSLFWVEDDALRDAFLRAGFPAHASTRSLSAFPAQQASSHTNHPPQSNGTAYPTRQMSAQTAREPSSPKPPLQRKSEASILTLPQEALSGSLEQRFAYFVQWLSTSVDAKSVFLADENGFVIASHEADEDDATWGVMLQQGMRTNRELLHPEQDAAAFSLDNAVLHMADGSRLVLLWAQSFQQSVTLGINVPSPPSPSLFVALRELLGVLLEQAESVEQKD